MKRVVIATAMLVCCAAGPQPLPSLVEPTPAEIEQAKRESCARLRKTAHAEGAVMVEVTTALPPGVADPHAPRAVAWCERVLRLLPANARRAAGVHCDLALFTARVNVRTLERLCASPRVTSIQEPILCVPTGSLEP